MPEDKSTYDWIEKNILPPMKFSKWYAPERQPGSVEPGIYAEPTLQQKAHKVGQDVVSHLKERTVHNIGRTDTRSKFSQREPGTEGIYRGREEMQMGEVDPPGLKGIKTGIIYSGKGSGKVSLYHGLPKESKRLKSGYIEGPAYFTPRKEIAGDYGEHIVKVEVPADKLKIDFDLTGGKLLSIDDANHYSGNEDWDIYDYLSSGQSVGVDETFVFDMKKFRQGEKAKQSKFTQPARGAKPIKEAPGGKLVKAGVNSLLTDADSIIMKSFSKNMGLDAGQFIKMARKQMGRKQWDTMSPSEKLKEARDFIKEGIELIPEDMERLGLTDIDDLLKIRATDPLDPANEFYAELLRRRGYKVTSEIRGNRQWPMVKIEGPTQPKVSEKQSKFTQPARGAKPVKATPWETKYRESNGTHIVEAVDVDGNVIGRGRFVNKGEGIKYEPGGTLYVEPNFRRKGIATEIYKKVEAETGKKLIKSPITTGEGAAFQNRYFRKR